MNKAQTYLINVGINDIVVANGDSKDPEDWKYLSDVLGEFHMMVSQQPDPDINNGGLCKICGGLTVTECCNCGAKY